MKNSESKLPILISVPHGGMMVPKELQQKCLIDSKGILMDGDTWTRELYDFRDLVEEYVDTDIARLVIDMNRSADDLPPSNPDGIVKTITVEGEQVWSQSSGLTHEEAEMLIQKYHIPYHQRLKEAVKSPKVVAAIDCHTMLDVGPSSGKSQWEARPLFCIGNRGSDTGGPLNEPITAPRELMVKLQESIQKEFEGFVPKDIQRPLVTLNTPFSGGYITRYHGNRSKIPWIQLEINRRLYLADGDDLSIIPDEISSLRLKEIRDKLYDVFKYCFNK